MGLFGKRKESHKTPAEPTSVKISPPASSEANAAPIDSEGFFQSHESKSVKGLKGIRQSVIDEKIVKMEQELANRPEQLDYRAFDDNSVKERELERAGGKIESICEQVSERDSMVKYKDIKEAIIDDIDGKVEKLADTYDYLSAESYNRNTAEFNDVINDEQQRADMEKEMAFVEHLSSRPSSMPPLSELYLDLMTDFVQSDIKAKPVDLPDEIPELSGDAVDAVTAKFEEKYSSMQQTDDTQQKETDEDEQAELERLRAMFG